MARLVIQSAKSAIACSAPRGLAPGGPVAIMGRGSARLSSGAPRLAKACAISGCGFSWDQILSLSLHFDHVIPFFKNGANTAVRLPPAPIPPATHRPAALAEVP